jgi:hypothetical protein
MSITDRRRGDSAGRNARSVAGDENCYVVVQLGRRAGAHGPVSSRVSSVFLRCPSRVGREMPASNGQLATHFVGCAYYS